jgi:hypothetical protein
MRDNERAAFEQFVQLVPHFAGHPVSWQPGADPPDVLCTSGTRRIGVELGEWLDEWQIAHWKTEERETESYSTIMWRAKTIALSQLNEVWMVPLRRLESDNAAAFDREFFEFIEKLDREWPTHIDHDDPQGLDIEDFNGYPTLGRYLAGLECYSTERGAPAGEWLNMYVHGAAYEPLDAVESLMKTFAKKCRMYQTLRADQLLDDLNLVLYYDQAWLYNTPYEGLNWGFRNVATVLRAVAAVEHGQFDRVFLLDAVNRRAERVWP